MMVELISIANPIEKGKCLGCLFKAEGLCRMPKTLGPYFEEMFGNCLTDEFIYVEHLEVRKKKTLS